MIGSGILVLVKRGGGAARPGPCEGKSESKSRSDSEIDYANEDDNDGERDSEIEIGNARGIESEFESGREGERQDATVLHFYLGFCEQRRVD